MCLEFEFKILARSVCFPLRSFLIKAIRAKGNLSPHILEYSTLRSKFKNQIWILNFVGAKLSCWHLRITSFWRQLGSSLGLDIPRYSSGGFLIVFFLWGLLRFSFLGELYERWNCEMVEWIFPSLGFYYASTFLENYINDHMPLLTILWFFILLPLLFSRSLPFYWRFWIVHVIEVPHPTNTSQQSLIFSLKLFRNWFFYFNNFFKIFLLYYIDRPNNAMQCYCPMC